MSGSSPTRSSRTFPTPSKGKSAAALTFALLVASSVFTAALPLLTPVPTRDPKITRRWALPGDPHGIAIGANGILYVGLAQKQMVMAIDSKSGAVLRQVVLDSAEIASTKELLTLRTNPSHTRLYIANGSDESVTILALPDLHVVREITIEGEPIRDALPDPKGRFLYLLGRRIHVYDADGGREIHALPVDDPMAIAVTSQGSMLAVVGTENYGSLRATAVTLFDPSDFHEIARDPLQTQKRIESALFAPNDGALLALGRDSLFEKPVRSVQKTMTATGGEMRMTIDFGDLVNTERICLPEGSGPQIATLATDGRLLFAERRCSSSGGFVGSNRNVIPVSLYNVAAYAIAFDRQAETLAVTDRAGFLTMYKVPRTPVVH